MFTPEFPKSMNLGHIFLLGLAKTVFLHCPVLHVSTHVEKQAMCVTNPFYIAFAFEKN